MFYYIWTNMMTSRLKKNILYLVGIVFILSSFGCRTAIDHPAPSQGIINTYRPENYGEILASDTRFDLEKGEISYTLPEPALVRLRVGIHQGGALLHHVLDWEPREAGRHVEKWDKKDTTRLIDFGDRSDYLLVLNCRPLKNKDGIKKAPQLTVAFPDAKSATPKSDPVVTGTVPLRVTLASEDSAWMNATKFEVALYVDYVFLMEDEVGTNPFNYHLDVSRFGEGEHILTVNVIGYDGQVGTKSVKFFVNK